MELGQSLKGIRRSKRLTLQQVASATGLSKSFVSQVESGTASPSIASLKRIADALSVPLGALFDSGQGRERRESDEGGDGTERTASDVKVVRRDRRKMLVWPGSNARTYLLTPDLQRKLEVILTEEDPSSDTGETYTHEGEEFGIVLEGCCEVMVGGQTYLLEEGDTIYYSSRIAHATRTVGERIAKTLWVITPPSF
jgi:transcriptional regulator with XRE-family HTH domain